MGVRGANREAWERVGAAGRDAVVPAPRRGLPTLVFISPDKTKPALRTEGMLPADQIKEIIINELQ